MTICLTIYNESVTAYAIKKTKLSPTRDSQCMINLSSTEEEMFQMKADLTRFKKPTNVCININDDNK